MEKRSKLEHTVAAYVTDVVAPSPVGLNARTILPEGKEIDITIPSLDLAIEVNGDLFHSTANISYTTEEATAGAYHQRKREEAEAQGFKLAYVWEEDYLLRRGALKKELYTYLTEGLLGPLLSQTTGPRDELFTLDDIFDWEDEDRENRLLATCVEKCSPHERLLLKTYVKDQVETSFKVSIDSVKLMEATSLPALAIKEALEGLVRRKILMAWPYRESYPTRGILMVNPTYLTSNLRAERLGEEIL